VLASRCRVAADATPGSSLGLARLGAALLTMAAAGTASVAGPGGRLAPGTGAPCPNRVRHRPQGGLGQIDRQPLGCCLFFFGTGLACHTVKQLANRDGIAGLGAVNQPTHNGTHVILRDGFQHGTAQHPCTPRVRISRPAGVAPGEPSVAGAVVRYRLAVW
jgi:hypothetical protein